MKRILIWLGIGVLLGGAVGFGAGIFFFPFLFPPPTANEVVAERETRPLLATGAFIHADPSDPVHWGKGGVEILGGPEAAVETGRVVHLRSDFHVGPGPRYHVYLADRADIMTNDDFKAAAVTDLGRLRAFDGSQVYPIPDGVDLARVKSVVIWCKAFNVLVSPATLKPPG